MSCLEDTHSPSSGGSPTSPAPQPSERKPAPLTEGLPSHNLLGHKQRTCPHQTLPRMPGDSARNGGLHQRGCESCLSEGTIKALTVSRVGGGGTAPAQHPQGTQGRAPSTRGSLSPSVSTGLWPLLEKGPILAAVGSLPSDLSPVGPQAAELQQPRTEQPASPPLGALEPRGEGGACQLQAPGWLCPPRPAPLPPRAGEGTCYRESGSQPSWASSGKEAGPRAPRRGHAGKPHGPRTPPCSQASLRSGTVTLGHLTFKKKSLCTCGNELTTSPPSRQQKTTPFVARRVSFFTKLTLTQGTHLSRVLRGMLHPQKPGWDLSARSGTFLTLLRPCGRKARSPSAGPWGPLRSHPSPGPLPHEGRRPGGRLVALEGARSLGAETGGVGHCLS